MDASPSPSPRRPQRARPSSSRAATGSPPPGPRADGGHRASSSLSYSPYNNPYVSNAYGFSDIAASLRPVQEYHNAFANADDPPTATPPPASSPFPSLSSASRALFSHRRQQSIPSLFPAVASIGKSLGRAISPERTAVPVRPPIPLYARADEEEEEGHSSSIGDSDSDSDSDSDGDGISEEDDDEEDDEQDHHRTMASYFGDDKTRRGAGIYTTYTSSRSRSRNKDNKTPSINTSLGVDVDTGSPVTGGGSGLSSWLSRGPKPGSPGRSAPPARGTTPEPPLLTATLRAGDTSATPRNSAAHPPALGAAGATSPSRFSQLAMSMSATLSRLTLQPSPTSPSAVSASRRQLLEGDELYHLDLGAALFPAGQPSDRDAFSPAAYKNLAANAAGILARFQTAYRQRTVAMLDLAAENGARDEELEEAATRVQSFKMQLEGMARRAAQQEKDVRALADDLAAERQARAQERAMLLASGMAGGMAGGMAAVLPARGDDDDDDETTTNTISICVSEDLGVEAAQRQQQQQQRQLGWRKSLKSDGSYDDSDEGDGESTPDDESSVFSRSRSPTSIHHDGVDAAATSIGATATTTAVAAHPRVAALGSSGARAARQPAATASAAAPQPLNPFQKLVKNVTGGAARDDADADAHARGPSTCRNCRGQDVSFAWNTVSVLRDENKHLKQRVGQLEVAVDGALDAVHGINVEY